MQKKGKKKKAASAKKKRVDGGSAKRASHALGVAIFLVSCAAALALLYFLLLVDKVYVEGAETLDPNDILSASGIRPGLHMLLIDEKAARASVLKNPYVDSFGLIRTFPDTVVLRIAERKPIAFIADAGGDAVLIDRAGNVLSIGGARAELIQVYGLGQAGYTLGESIVTGVDFQAGTLLEILSAVEAAGLENEVVSVNVANALSIELTMLGGYLVKLGQPDALEEKLKDLSSVLAELEKMGASGGVIYLASRGGPVYSPPDAQPVIAPTDPMEPFEPADPESTPHPALTPAPQTTAEPSFAPTPGDGDGFSG